MLEAPGERQRGGSAGRPRRARTTRPGGRPRAPVLPPRRTRGSAQRAAGARPVASAERVELLGRELADRLEHEEAVALAGADEALVDERLRDVEVGVRQTASAALSVQPPAKTASRANALLLVGVEQVVAPLDRRAQRLLPRVDAAARLQQVEPAREAVEELRGREHAHARGGELERERQLLEPRAELGDAVGGGERRIGARSARERKSSTPSSGRSAVTGYACSPGRRSTSRLVTSSVQVRARGEQRRDVVGARRSGARSCRARAGATRSAMCSATSCSAPSACATRRQHELAGRRAARAAPSRRRRRSCRTRLAAACSASRVLPMPPGPVSVSRRGSFAREELGELRRARRCGRGTASRGPAGSCGRGSSAAGTPRCRTGRSARARRDP